jgi:CheY-like chemotaxis protein
MQPGSGPAPTRRILVVDDNRDAAESLAMLLRVYGHDVRVAHDGLTALAVARAFHPEIVLLDLNLPRLDGRQVARQMRHEEGLDKALLVAVTGYPTRTRPPPRNPISTLPFPSPPISSSCGPSSLGGLSGGKHSSKRPLTLRAGRGPCRPVPFEKTTSSPGRAASFLLT